jgi:hypothetical protein
MPYTSITVALSDADVQSIKTNYNLAANQSTAFLSAASNFVFDRSGNAMIAISNSTALAANQYFSDTSQTSAQ